MITDISKLTIFGDSSGSGQGKTDVTEDTRIKTLERRSFRGNMRLKEITMSGNNLGILYPYVFYHLRDLKILIDNYQSSMGFEISLLNLLQK